MMAPEAAATTLQLSAGNASQLQSSDAKANAIWPGEPIDLRYLFRIFWISEWLWR
jgi:hypothetical protein